MNLKQVIKYDNANAIEATWVDADGAPILCKSYADVQMQDFRDDVANYGGDISEHEALIAEVEANIVPVPPETVQVPQVITIRQAKLVLLDAGLLDDVDAAVAQADKATQIEWEYATEVRRDWPTLLVMQAALGLTDDQVDQLFIQGSAL